ncbi:MAG: LamG domain-containing protein, partial [Halobacteriaceae archaeon]
MQDWSGLGNSGTAKNGVDTSADGFRPQSNSYKFDGKDDYIDLGADAIDSVESGFATGAWVKFDNARDGKTSISSKDDNSTIDVDQVSWNLDLRSDGQVRFWFGGGGQAAVYTRPIPDNNTWHHITAVWDGTENIIYMDGQKQDSLSNSMNPGPNNKKAYIGTWAGQSSWVFDGNIDEVRIYNRSLSAQEIRSSYRAMTWTSQWLKWPETHYDGPTPISRWEFSRGAGQTVKDIEGDNDGTLGSGSGSASDDPTWVQDCRTDGCMSFDGSDDYITGTGFNNSDYNQDYTWSVWFKSSAGGTYQRLIGA